jgi:hypothetical protein
MRNGSNNKREKVLKKKRRNKKVKGKLNFKIKNVLKYVNMSSNNNSNNNSNNKSNNTLKDSGLGFPEPLVEIFGGIDNLLSLPVYEGEIMGDDTWYPKIDYPNDAFTHPIMRGITGAGFPFLAFRIHDQRGKSMWKKKYAGDGTSTFIEMIYGEQRDIDCSLSEDSKDRHIIKTKYRWNSQCTPQLGPFISGCYTFFMDVREDDLWKDRLRRLINREPCGHMTIGPSAHEEEQRMMNGKPVVSLV